MVEAIHCQDLVAIEHALLVPRGGGPALHMLFLKALNPFEIFVLALSFHLVIGVVERFLQVIFQPLVDLQMNVRNLMGELSLAKSRTQHSGVQNIICNSYKRNAATTICTILRKGACLQSCRALHCMLTARLAVVFEKAQHC